MTQHYSVILVTCCLLQTGPGIGLHHSLPQWASALTQLCVQDNSVL